MINISELQRERINVLLGGMCAIEAFVSSCPKAHEEAPGHFVECISASI
jgi:hypothetical protein